MVDHLTEIIYLKIQKIFISYHLIQTIQVLIDAIMDSILLRMIIYLIEIIYINYSKFMNI